MIQKKTLFPKREQLVYLFPLVMVVTWNFPPMFVFSWVPPSPGRMWGL